MHFLRLLILCWLILFLPAALAGDRALVRADGLAAMVNQGPYRFSHVRDNPTTEGIRRQVVRYEVDGLVQYALVLWPVGEAPGDGWPVLQFNHGFHPDPPRNGFNARGESDRPGDYYRETVQAFAREGFVVVAPDYRGHNISDGGEFTARPEADAWYSRDAIACFLAIQGLPGLDLEKIYMLGHSMGGAVTLRSLQVLGEKVRAASVWSTAGEEYGDSELSPFKRLEELQVPLSIQHSEGDAATKVANSRELATRLQSVGAAYQLNIFPSDEHLFADEDFVEAIARDLAWFRRYR